MGHLPALVSDLALILFVASIVTIIFKTLKQPVVLGYILSGFLISPHFVLLPSLADASNIATWSEIGVIFLLFSLGLEFSFKKLFSVGSTVFIATAISICSMITLGFLVGQLLGWTTMESIFLGAMISMSSTMIILKAFDEMGVKKQRFAGIVFGMLIVEDLAAILMLVLLSTMAVSRDFEGTELLMQVLKLVFFVAIWLIVGIYVFPTLLEKIKKLLNDETLLVLSIGLCLCMVLFATSVGFSAALGAFIMGSILSETLQVKRIEHLIEPLKNLFGAVFFVSVGMMIEPTILVEYSIPIMIITMVVIIGMVLFSSLGIVLSGESLKIALQSGFSLAQIGEFSFIIATLGVQLGVISSFLYPIIVSVSVITSFITPFLMKATNPIYETIEKRIPIKWSKIITGYSAHKINKSNEDNQWKRYFKSTSSSIGVYTLLSVAILVVSKLFLSGFIIENIDGIWGYVIHAGITIIAMSPFMNAMMLAGTNNISNSNISDARDKWSVLSSSHRFGIICLIIIKHLIPIAMITFVLYPILEYNIIILCGASLLIAILVKFMRRVRHQTTKMEERFKDNLSDKHNDNNKTMTAKVKEELKKKSIHVERIEVSANYSHIGKTLGELNFRRTTGISIVSIIRGNEIINIPNSHTQLFPFDKVVIVGSDEEVQKFMKIIENSHKEENISTDVHKYRVELEQYELEAGNQIISHTIRELNIQKKTGCLITGIEREDKMIVKFSADFKFKQDDILWIAGEKQKILDFEASLFSKSNNFVY